MSGPSTAVGLAVFPSSSRGLGAVEKEYLEQASMLYKEFLTGGLSQLIEEDEGSDLRHTLIRHAFLTACLSYKNMLKSEENDTEKIELCDELMKVKQTLAVMEGREKKLVAELKESRFVKRPWSWS
ncbi:hypothetical protein ACOSP7_015151 [Xanthoceras sorbifolium]